MKITFAVNQAAALRAGVDAPSSTAALDIDPSTMPVRAREFLATHLTDGHKIPAMAVELTTPSFEGLYAALENKFSAEDEAKAKFKRDVEAVLAAWRSMSDEELSDSWNDYNGYPTIRDYFSANVLRASMDRLETTQSQLSAKMLSVKNERIRRAKEKAEAIKAEQEKQEQAKNAAEQQKQDARAEWLDTVATTVQVEAYKRGLLPESVIDRGIEAQAFAPLAHIPLYTAISEDEVLEAYEEILEELSSQEVNDEHDYDATTATEERLARLSEIEEALPGCTTKLKCRCRVMKNSSGEQDDEYCVSRYAIEVRYQYRGFHFRRDYAAS